MKKQMTLEQLDGYEIRNLLLCDTETDRSLWATCTLSKNQNNVVSFEFFQGDILVDSTGDLEVAISMYNNR